MKSAFFALTSPQYEHEMDEHGFDRCWATFSVPVLPAYAILNYTIQGVTSKYNGVTGQVDGAVGEIDAEIVGDKVIVYGVDDLTQSLRPSVPSLVINYLGIRDYALFFPHFDNEKIRARAARFLEEEDKTFEESSWLAFAMMAGAVFESLLLDVVGIELDKSGEPKKVTFGQYIKKVKKTGVFSADDLDALNIAKESRNLIHAGRYEDPYVSREEAMKVRLVLEQFLRRDWVDIKQQYRAAAQPQ